MRTPIRVLFAASALTIGLALSLTACGPTLSLFADITGTEVVPESVRGKAYKAASVSFTAWESIQGAIEKYGRLPPCVDNGPIICRSAKAWAKIKEIERKTTGTLLATRPIIEAGTDDVQLLMAIPSVVFDAQKAFDTAREEGK